MDAFRWNTWNFDHATRHGITPDEAEAVMQSTVSPYPEEIGENKWLVRGQGYGGRYVQVIFVYDDDGETVYIIHARPLTDKEKRRYRRRKR
jgi:uncharacterized DUF497 family protein